MSTATHFDIDPDEFWQDPYPTLKQMRQRAAIARYARPAIGPAASATHNVGRAVGPRRSTIACV